MSKVSPERGPHGSISPEQASPSQSSSRRPSLERRQQPPEQGLEPGQAAGPSSRPDTGAGGSRASAEQDTASPTQEQQQFRSSGEQRLRQLRQMAYAAKPVSQKKKGMVGAFGSLFSAGLTVKPAAIDISRSLSQRMSQLQEHQPKVDSRKSGLARMKVAEEMAYRGSTLAGFFGREKRDFGRLSEVTRAQVEALKEAGLFEQGMTELSLLTPVHIYLETKSEKKIQPRSLEVMALFDGSV